MINSYRFDSNLHCVWLKFVLFGMLFLAYPLSLFLPVRLGVPLTFHISLPVQFWASLISLFYLWFGCFLPGNTADGIVLSHRCLRYVITVVLASLAVSAYIGDSADIVPFVELAGAFLIVLFFAVCSKCVIPDLSMIMGLFWLVQISHGLWQFSVGFTVVGTAGNQNWAAPLFVASAPWFIKWQLSIIRSRVKNSRIAEYCVAGAICVAVFFVTLLLVARTSCRATLVVLAAYAGWFVLVQLQKARWLRIGFVAAAVAALLMLGLSHRTSLEQAVQTDIRIPCWLATASMIYDHPIFGVGPGNYRREFAEYRLMEHKARAVAETITEHPHNEILHIASMAGIPLALFWIFLLSPLLFRQRTVTEMLIHFTAFVVVGHAMFDKQLIQPPSSLVGFFFVGMLWRPWISSRLDVGISRNGARRAVAGIGAALLITLGVYAGWKHIYTGVLFRFAHLAEDRGDYLAAYGAYKRAAEIYPQMVQTNAYAGICANRGLRNPKMALPHLIRVLEMEPSFGHINGDIALALGNLGDHRQALPFFEREAQLFPFDSAAWLNLFLNKLRTEDYGGIFEVYDRLAALRCRRLKMKREGIVVELTNTALDAVEQGNDKSAMRLSELIAVFFPEKGFELPLAHSLLAAVEAANDGTGELLKSNLELWKIMVFWRRKVLNLPTPGVPEIYLEFKAMSENRLLPSFYDGDVESVRAYAALAEFIRQAGMACALVQIENKIEALEVHDGNSFWLISLADGIVFKGLPAFLFEDDLGHILRTSTSGSVSYLLPVTVNDFSIVFQAVGHIIRCGTDGDLPFLGQSPSLRKRQYLDLLAGSTDHDLIIPALNFLFFSGGGGDLRNRRGRCSMIEPKTRAY